MTVDRPAGVTDEPTFDHLIRQEAPMTTNDERMLHDDRVLPDEQVLRDERATAMPEGYREGADADTGVITSGHPERVSDEAGTAPDGARPGSPFDDRFDDGAAAGRGAHVGGSIDQASGTSGMSAGTTAGHDTAADDDWNRLAADFVDDPQRAVGEAARLVRDAVERTTATDGAADTEGLRAAFRRLRDLHRTLVSH